MDVKSLEQISVDPKKLNKVKIKVEEVMADIPGVVNGPVRVRYFQLLPFGGSSISADVMASFFKRNS